MKLRHIRVLREIQSICEEIGKYGCSKSCPFFNGTFFNGSPCMLRAVPERWELDKFKVEV